MTTADNSEIRLIFIPPDRSHAASRWQLKLSSTRPLLAKWNSEEQPLGQDAENWKLNLDPRVRDLIELYRDYAQNLGADPEEPLITIPGEMDTAFLISCVSTGLCFLETGTETLPLSVSRDFAGVKIELKASPRKLVLQTEPSFCFIETTRRLYRAERGAIAPIPEILPRDALTSLFIRGEIPLEDDLLEALMKLTPPARGFFILPELIPGDMAGLSLELVPASDFAEVRVGIKLPDAELSAPLPLDHLRRAVTYNDPVWVSADNKLIRISSEMPAYASLKELHGSIRGNFFSFLNEISSNRIVTRDLDTLYSRFLPRVAKFASLRSNGASVEVAEHPSTFKLTLLPSTFRQDYFEVGFDFQLNGHSINAAEAESIAETGHVRLGDEMVLVDEPLRQKFKELFHLIRKKKGTPAHIPAARIPILASFFNDIHLPEQLSGMMEHRSASGEFEIPELPIPGGLAALLRNYQKTGFRWLGWLDRFGFGGILADEMGLGKTLQVLTFLLYKKVSPDHGPKKPSLIIAPTALLRNWSAEIYKFIGRSLDFTIIEGTPDSRKKKIKSLNSLDLGITSYPLLQNDLEYYKAIEFDWCILDEAQHIKNRDARRTQCVKEINAQHRLAVTGTPLENNPAELWSLFDFILPGYLGTYGEYKALYESPLLSIQLQERQKASKELRDFIAPFVLRRTKAEVLQELPPKIEQDIELELTDTQKTAYLAAVSQIKNDWQSGSSRTTIELLAALTRLRQICLHPALIDPDLGDQPETSVKLQVLLELLDEARDSGHRVVIFSQFVEMLTLIRKSLDGNTEYLYIDGRTKNRVELARQFNEGNIPIFLISLKAGGTGLNVTGADTVILFDPWWNPAVENQAIDRTHRMGQTRSVQVFRLVTSGTIEDKIQNLKREKQKLFDDLMESSPGLAGKLTPEILEQLLDCQLEMGNSL